MEIVTTEIERAFRSWLKAQLYGDGMRVFTDNEISAYAYALRSSCEKVEQLSVKNLFYYRTAEDLERETGWLKLDPVYQEIDKAGNGTLSAAVKLYDHYLMNGNDSTAPEVHAAFYLSGDSGDIARKETSPVEFYYREIPMKPIQRVYYGAPGTGKSYSVRKLLEAEYPDNAELRTHIKRVIFHPAYTYGDFVGAIKPLISLERPLDYVFVAGPFAELLKAAFLNPEEKYYLIIEEINRGYAPAIFGDIFQLLDRGPGGKSEYAIVNRDLGAYFSRDPWMKNIFYDGMVWLPSNFNIIATMNTADENIFVMDTAFKRRFELVYVPIDFEILPEDMKKERAVFYGARPLTEVFENSGINGEFARRLAARGMLKRNWGTFASLVNNAIDAENLEGKKMGKPHNALIAENKKLGPFFVRPEELDNADVFFNKVIFYLKQDVFCDSPGLFTGSFEDIYEKYGKGGSDIFELLV
ncbi:MAG: AAA family ATPase [Lachnospiraceae bacterium]|nr:AAA family ATPase [Lachnospiraceae bacterium]